MNTQNKYPAIARSIATVAMSIAMTIVLASCGSGSDQTTNPPPNPPAIPNAVIGIGGGSVTHATGAKVTIPAGVLIDDTSITIAEDSAGAPPVPNGVTPISSIYAITPHGTDFIAPVNVKIPFTASQVPAGSTPALLKTNGRGGWMQVAGTIDTGSMSGPINQFSHIAVYCCFLPPFRIIGQPIGFTVPEDGFTIFHVDVYRARATLFFEYQWSGVRVNGGLVSFNGTTTDRTAMILPAVYADNGAQIRVTVSAYENVRVGSNIVKQLVGTETSNAATLTVIPKPPLITQQPQSVSVTAGSTATFTVAANGAGLTYQWRRVGPIDVVGATAPTLTLTNVQLTDSGETFRVLIKNANNVVVTSDPVTLTVTPAIVAPTITRPPSSASVRVGQSATFTVGATGSSLTYQWERSDNSAAFAPIGNATSATYTIPNVTANDNGARFRVAVTNGGGTVTSTPPATLTVSPNTSLALTRLGANSQQTVALKGDGRLLAWGSPSRDVLGIAGNVVLGVPGYVESIANAATFSIGSDHAIALTSDGSAWTWGRNLFGQLGNGGASGGGRLPAVVAGVAQATQASAGTWFTLVVSTDGRVRAWGDNRFGQLGDGTMATRYTPTEVQNLSAVRRVAAGALHSLALKTDGTVWTWGNNSAGQLGDGTLVDKRLPVQVMGLPNIVSIAACEAHSLAIASDGSVYAWGKNSVGQLGDGTLDDRQMPVQVRLAPVVIAATCAPNGNFSLALKSDGTVWGWGDNEFGQLGNGTIHYTPIPTSVGGTLPANIQSIAAGSIHSVALAANGEVWGWGYRENGQLLEADNSPRLLPLLLHDINLQ